MVVGVPGGGIKVVREGGRGPPLVVAHLWDVVREPRLDTDGVAVSWVVSVADSAKSKPFSTPRGASFDSRAEESGGRGNFERSDLSLAGVVDVVERAWWESVVRQMTYSL